MYFESARQRCRWSFSIPEADRRGATIRANARQEVDRIWEEQAKKLTPPAPLPIPEPTWGMAPPAPPPPPVAPPAPPSSPPIEESDPGIGPVARLAEPIGDYWSADPRPPGQIETIV